MCLLLRFGGPERTGQYQYPAQWSGARRGERVQEEPGAVLGRRGRGEAAGSFQVPGPARQMPHRRGPSYTPSTHIYIRIYIVLYVKTVSVLDQFVSAAPGGGGGGVGDSARDLLHLLSSLRHVGLPGSFASDAMKVSSHRLV